MSSDLKDLSDYCVIKKYPDGWMISKKSDEKREVKFIPRLDLVRMGYTQDNRSVPPAPPNSPTVIIVPTSPIRDLEGNWRRH